MPNTSTYTDVVLDWDKLLSAVDEHEPVLPDVQEDRQDLSQTREVARMIKARQQSHAAARQQATQELDQVLEHGREVAMRLRAAVISAVGPRNEILVQFGIAPLRRRVRKPKVAPFPPPPPTPEAPAPVEGE